MDKEVHDVTARVIVEFTRNLYRGHAEKYSGDCTLNELRVMNQIILCRLKGRFCSVTALHEATGIPLPTVSRCVSNMRSKGRLIERSHPDDGRRRIISVDSRFLRATKRDIEQKAEWFNRFRDNGQLAKSA